MFDEETRKKVDKVIDNDKKRAKWEGKFPGHTSSSGELGPMY